MKRLRSSLVAAGAGLVLALAAPGGAGAAQVIGQTSGGAGCPENRAWTQGTLTSGNSYSPSSYGVITSWSMQAQGATAGRSLQLLVLRHNPGAGPNHFIATQKDSQVRTLAVSQLNTFTGMRIPIEVTERLGLYVPPGQPGGVSECASLGMGGDVLRSSVGDPPLNMSVDYTSTNVNRLNASAVVEPDTDRDVFGDETQDNCIGTMGTVGGCPNTLTAASATGKGNKVLVTVTAPGAGTLKAGSTTDPTLLAATAKKKKKAQPPLTQTSQTLTAKTKQTVTLTLNLSKSGKAKLARKGKLGVTIKVLYTPTGGTAGAVTTTAKLGKKKKKKG